MRDFTSKGEEGPGGFGSTLGVFESGAAEVCQAPLDICSHGFDSLCLMRPRGAQEAEPVSSAWLAQVCF